MLDELIHMILRRVRREYRAYIAKGWPIVGATILEFFTEPEFGGICPVVVYSYQFKDERWCGACTGFAIKHLQFRKLRASVKAIPALQIRYDPTDPGTSCVLNRDNPKLPFKIDHDPGPSVLAGLTRST